MEEEQSSDENMELYSFSLASGDLVTSRRGSPRCSEGRSNSVVSEDCLLAADNIVFCGKIFTSDEQPATSDKLTGSMKESPRNVKLPVASFRRDGSHNKNNRKKAELSTIKKGKDPDHDQLRKVWRSEGNLGWCWLFLLGGIRSRFQLNNELELMRDIKSRQSRVSPTSSSKLFRLESNGGGDKAEMMIGGNGILNESRRRGLPGEGLCGLLKAISGGAGWAGQRHPDSVVNNSPSIGRTCNCIPKL